MEERGSEVEVLLLRAAGALLSGGDGGGGDATRALQASLVGLWEGAPRGAGWRLPLLLLLARGLLPPPLLAEVERPRLRIPDVLELALLVKGARHEQ